MVSKTRVANFFNQKIASIFLSRNERFANKHKGESCYIFGNGSSIKFMDLKNFSDRVSIGCNSLFLHKSFNELNCIYYALPAPFLFGYFRKYYNEHQFNYMGRLFLDRVKNNSHVNFFTSLSNICFTRGKNVFYMHHFAKRNPDLKFCDPSFQFSFMDGALNSMIGLAIWLGYKDIILVGCDYLLQPSPSLHFFERGCNILNSEVTQIMHSQNQLVDSICSIVDIKVMGLDYNTSGTFPLIKYSEFFNVDEKFSENYEIVSQEYLSILSSHGFYRIFK